MAGTDTESMTSPDPGEERLLERLRAGDQAAFMELVDRHSAAMLRVAQLFVPSRAVAEEVVQETWLGALRGPTGRGGSGRRAHEGRGQRTRDGRPREAPARSHALLLLGPGDPLPEA